MKRVFVKKSGSELTLSVQEEGKDVAEVSLSLQGAMSLAVALLMEALVLVGDRPRGRVQPSSMPLGQDRRFEILGDTFPIQDGT